VAHFGDHKKLIDHGVNLLDVVGGFLVARFLVPIVPGNGEFCKVLIGGGAGRQ
jgi:hypothetical protein